MSRKIVIRTEVGSEYHGTVDGNRVHIEKRVSGHNGDDYAYSGYVRGGLAEMYRLLTLDREARRFTIDLDAPITRGYGTQTQLMGSFVSTLDVEPAPIETFVIDATPTDEGFVNIAKTMVKSILGDVRVSRRSDNAALLGQVVRIAGYIGSKDPQALLDLQSWVEAQ